MSTTQHTQITTVAEYDVSRMIFSEPSSGCIPDSKPKIEFKRINVSTRNEDGTVGELILPTTRLFSFGVSENTSQETGSVNGYTFPICLWNRDAPTEEEKKWTEVFTSIVDKCVEHLLDNKEEIDMFDLTKADLVKTKGGLNPLYWKKEKFTNDKGKIVLRTVPGSGPTLYTKLIYSKKHNKFLSQFFDVNDEPVDALSLMGKYCYTKAAIKVESIFIGSKISLQVKLYEAVIEPTASGMKRLLQRPVTSSVVNEALGLSSMLLNDNSDTGSLLGDDDNTETKLPTEEQKVVRRVKKIVAKR